MNKFLFVGNRKFVLEEMIKLNLDVDILVIKNTHLEKDELLKNYKHTIISSKEELLDYINKKDFDIFLSNGCPFILPIKHLKKKTYVNIHPSFLPDLKGIDPCLGSILFSRDCGATCHHINEVIDGGDIISRVKIPFSKDLDVSLMYQLSFIAEKEVFHEAFKANFLIRNKQEVGDWIYYSRKENDKKINFNENPNQLIQRIKTFNNKSQGCTFINNNNTFKVYEASQINNLYVVNYSKNFKNLEIMFVYEDCVVFKKDDVVIKLSKVSGPLNTLKVKNKINS